MNQMSKLLVIALLLLLIAPTAIGQDGASLIEPQDMDMMNLEAHISFPPPVYVVRESVEFRGTVTLASLVQFFVEIRPLALGMTMDDESAEANPWVPATLPRLLPVTDDVLGAWNTVSYRDGLYEARLVVLTSDGEPAYYRVSPLRVENSPPAFVAEQQVVEVIAPTDVPEPTATPDSSPRVTALVNSNVRAGDSTLYHVVGGLREGESASIRGISSFGTGWFYIELDTGRSGFIHPNIVQAEGDLSNLRRINPPPLPPTPIPQPTAIPVAAPASTGANLRIIHVQIRPHPAVCNEAYEAQVTVINDGSAAATSGFAIEVRDTRHDGQGEVKSVIGGTPLAAGEQRTYSGHLTTGVYVGELHHINVVVDFQNEVGETNENDNLYATAPYFLARGSC